MHRCLIERQLMRNWKSDAHLYGIYVSMTHEYTCTCICKPSRSIFQLRTYSARMSVLQRREREMNACLLSSADDSVIQSNNNRVCVIGFASPTDCRTFRIANHEYVQFRSAFTHVTHLASPSARSSLHEEHEEDTAWRAAAIAVPYRIR